MDEDVPNGGFTTEILRCDSPLRFSVKNLDSNLDEFEIKNLK